MVGLSIDCRSLTNATCGIAIAGDQQSLIADLILDLGITKASKIAGAIQRKQEYLSTWVDAYQLYQGKCNQANSVKGTLKDRFVKAWDSWPAKVWKMTTESVQLVKEHIALNRVERCAGILMGFWNTFRGRTVESNVKQEQPDDVDTAEYPMFFTGDLPMNSIVGLDCQNRPHPMPFINAINGSKNTHDDDQRIHIEASKDPQLWQGPLAQRLQDLKAGLKDNWSTKKRGALVTACLDKHSHELSEKEHLLFTWKCIHITLGGTSTSNPKTENVFDYIHYALKYNSDFVLDIIQGTGLTGLYSVSGYTISEPMLDTWVDERMDYIWGTIPNSRVNVYSHTSGLSEEHEGYC